MYVGLKYVVDTKIPGSNQFEMGWNKFLCRRNDSA